MYFIFYLILFIILTILIVVILLRFKFLKLPNVFLITGGVKTGKSFLSVALAIQRYRINCLKCKLTNIFIDIINFFRRCFKRVPFPYKEKPMLYSNIKLRNILYNQFTLDILLRRVRIPYKSVVLIDEISLLADSMLYKNKDINNQLMLFVKLFGHYSRGGTLIVNTQSIQDCHFAFKRCISSYLWIHSKTKMPFVTLFKVRELMYSEDNSSITNSINNDVETDCKPLIFLNKYYKYYDCYCYSIFTDNLYLNVDYDSRVLKRKDSLKTPYIISLQDFKGINTSGIDLKEGG